MIIIYDLNTKDILQIENNVMIPTLPITQNETIEEKMAIYQSDGKSFMVVPYEMDYRIFDFKVCFDIEGNFVGLQPK